MNERPKDEGPARYSPEAERALLGTLLLDGHQTDDVVALNASDFHEIPHRRIYAAMQELSSRGELTIDTLAYTLESCTEVREVGGYAYLTGLLAAGGGMLEPQVKFITDLSRERWATEVVAPQIARACKEPAVLAKVLSEATETLAQRWDGKAGTTRLQFTPAELCALPIPETKFVVPGRVPKGGLGALIGMWGDAKSLLTAQGGLCFNRGLNFWGQPATDVGNVLYLGHDMPQSMHQERFLELCKGLQIDPPGREFILDISGLDIRAKDGAVTLRHMVEGEGAALLVVDSFAAYFVGDENNAAEMSAFTERLREIGQLTDCTTLILHHPTKQEGGDLSTRARGSGAFMANIDACYWIVGKGPITARERTLQTVKFRQANPLPPQAITLVNPPHGGLVVAFGEQREPVTSALLWETVAAEFMRQLQHADTGMTREQLEADTRAAGMQFGRSTATKAMQVLEQDPGVKSRSSFNGKVYSWTE